MFKNKNLVLFLLHDICNGKCNVIVLKKTHKCAGTSIVFFPYETIYKKNKRRSIPITRVNISIRFHQGLEFLLKKIR